MQGRISALLWAGGSSRLSIGFWFQGVYSSADAFS